jgi:hypothetical protein
MAKKKVRREEDVDKPKTRVRAAWDTASKAARAHEDEELLLPAELQNDFDEKEWTW